MHNDVNVIAPTIKFELKFNIRWREFINSRIVMKKYSEATFLRPIK